MSFSNNDYQSEREFFLSYLKLEGLRASRGRMLVFDEVFYLHGHFSTELLIKKLNEKKLKLSRSTVYRCVKELLAARVIRCTAFGEKHQNYEHVYDVKAHHHAYCIKTGKHFALPELEEEKVYLPILEKLGFEVLGHEIHFYGISKEAKEKK